MSFQLLLVQQMQNSSFTGFGYFTGSNVYISDWGDTSGGIATQQFAWSGMHSVGDASDNRRYNWCCRRF